MIDLLYFGSCTPTETAVALGILVPTVKTRPRTAIRVLAGLARPGWGSWLRMGSA